MKEATVFEFTYLSLIFYALGALVLACSLLAVTRENPVHAVVYLIGSFLGTAMIFFLLGAPLLAALEVILYAGAFMVLFLFIITTLPTGKKESRPRWRVGRWAPGAGLAAVSLIAVLILIGADPAGRVPLPAAMARPAVFGQVLFDRYWFAVETASFLLFVGLVGALYLARKPDVPEKTPTEGKP